MVDILGKEIVNIDRKMDKEEIFVLINNNIGKFFVQKSVRTFLPSVLSIQFSSELIL